MASDPKLRSAGIRANVEALLAAMAARDYASVGRLAPLAAMGTRGKPLPMAEAIESGDEQLVASLLPYCDGKGIDDRDDPSLLICARAGNVPVAKLMLQRADPTLADHRGQTAFVVAASRGDRAMVELLAPVSALASENGQASKALLAAAGIANLDCIQAVLAVAKAAQADIDWASAVVELARASEFEDAAARSNWRRCFDAIVEGRDLDDRDASGSSLLMRLVGMRGEAAESALTALSRADARIANHDGDTALLLAVRDARYPSIDTVAALLPRSDPNHRNKAGDTALHAALHRRLFVPDVLGMLAKATSPTALNANGHTPLMAIIHRWTDGNLESYQQESAFQAIVRLALDTDINARGAHGETALMLAFRLPDIFYFILRMSNPDIQDNEGRTALMLAAQTGQWWAGQHLLEVADVNLRDVNGRSAREFAREAGHDGFADRIAVRQAEVEADELAKTARKPGKISSKRPSKKRKRGI